MASPSWPTALAAALVCGILLLTAGILAYAFVETLTTTRVLPPPAYYYVTAPGAVASLMTAAFCLWRYRGGVGYAAAGAVVLTGLWFVATTSGVGRLVENFSVGRLYLTVIVSGGFGVGGAFVWLPVCRAITRRNGKTEAAAGGGGGSETQTGQRRPEMGDAESGHRRSGVPPPGSAARRTRLLEDNHVLDGGARSGVSSRRSRIPLLRGFLMTKTPAAAAVWVVLTATAVTIRGTGGRNIWEQAMDALRTIF